MIKQIIILIVIAVLFSSCGEHYNGTIWGDRNLGIYITDTIIILPKGKWDVYIDEGSVQLIDSVNLIRIRYSVGFMNTDILDTCYGRRIPQHDSIVPTQIEWKKK
jgi:hypothetical protein